MIGDACGKLLGKGGTLWIPKAHTEFKRRLKEPFGLSKKKFANYFIEKLH